MVEQTKQSRKSSETTPDLNSPSLYLNRELSLLEFEDRVISQACDERHPLLEQVRFLSMSSDQLDEFFMVRVSDLQDEVERGQGSLSPEGMTPAQQLAAIRKRVTALFDKQRQILCQHLLPLLTRENIRIVDLKDLNTAQRAAMRGYFERDVFPVLTPLAVDPGHPFPHISNQSVNLAVELAGDGTGETRFARVKIPDVLPRLIHVERVLGQHTAGKSSKYTFVWLDQLVAANLPSLFPGIPVLASHSFRVIRDADIEIHEEEGADLRISVERGLNQRRFGEAVAMLSERGMPERVRSLIATGLKISHDEIYEADLPLGLNSLSTLTRVDRPDLKYPQFVPHLPAALLPGEPIMNAIERHDVLVQHPYDSFAPVIDLLTAAARDPNVLAIKQTLYRVGTDSPVVRALLEAANHGKQVAVLVELKARFDEASNIEWARELERAGVHVAYGFFGLKTHAKVLLIVRKERAGIRRYVHVGTGNYNVSTARAYTDLGLFTADPDFGADATDLFNYLTGYSHQTTYHKFLVAPVTLRSGLMERIEREIRWHKREGNGHLQFKMNSLVDPAFIKALYRASQAGVRVDLIVRGACCLRPGVPGVSDKIHVRSIIGRFLEHSRVYWFRNGGEPEMLAGSADLMPRNLDHRVEVLFPIGAPDLRERIEREVFELEFRDTANAWEEQPDGTYRRVHPGPEPFDSQTWMMEHAE